MLYVILKMSPNFLNIIELAQSGDWSEIINIIKNDAKLALEVEEDNTSLLMHLSGYPGSAEIIEELINLGADPNQRAFSGWTALGLAISSGSRYGLNSEKVIKVLIDNGVDPNQVVDWSWPALHWAICCQRPDYLPILLNSGADPMLLDDELSESALDTAYRVRSSESVSILTSYMKEKLIQ